MEMAAAAALPAVNTTAPSQRQSIPFRFTATGGEYFRIWIVNLLLTVLTLGIYSAWAKVRRLRYFYGNTSVAGSSFEYHGQPGQILKGRLIALAAIAVYSVCTRLWPLSIFIMLPLLAVAMPWVVVRSRKFQMQMTSWRNIRFRFHGAYKGALIAYIGWTVIAAFTLYIMLPRALYARIRFLLSNTSFGTRRLEFDKPVGPYYKLFYVTLLLGLGALFALLIIAGIGIAILGGAGLFTNTNPAALGTGVMVAVGLYYLASLVIFTAVGASYATKFANTSFDGLALGSHSVRCQLETGKMVGLYLSNLFLMLVTLGLYYPWARVRLMKYRLESLSIETHGSLDDFVASADAAQSATGEELGEFFDVDFGF